MSTHAYRAFGLAVASELTLPEFAPGAATSEAPDLVVRLVPERFADWLSASEPGRFKAHENGFLLHVPDVALYKVSDGVRVEIAPEPEADPGLVRLFTIGSAMGMALHQRGVLVLHGATVARDGPDGPEARVLVGDTGAGKSTLAARLGQAGLTVLGDDTMAVFPAAGTGRPYVWPGSGVFKLWRDSLDQMGLPSDRLIRLGNRADKFYLPNPGAASDPLSGIRLAEILMLDETEDGPPGMTPVTGLHALRVVSQNTYRPEYVTLLRREAAHFRQCVSLVQEVPVSRLTRPWGIDHFPATIDLLLGRWDTQSGLGLSHGSAR